MIGHDSLVVDSTAEVTDMMMFASEPPVVSVDNVMMGDHEINDGRHNSILTYLPPHTTLHSYISTLLFDTLTTTLTDYIG